MRPKKPSAGQGAGAGVSVRKPRLLWANCYCLMDTSSGASMAVREMLQQLVRSGWQVGILGCTVFDAERGTSGMAQQWPEVQKRRGEQVIVEDGLLSHRLYVTRSTRRDAMLSQEIGAWFSLYQQALDQFRPDIVFYYGGQPTDLLIPVEARVRGIPTAFYLANGNYRYARWARDVDLVLTDSQATADMYKQRLGVQVTAVGAFIDAAKVVAEHHSRERVLFVNPRLEKGVGVVVRIAMMLQERRPDIVFEVVESRSTWAEALRLVTPSFGPELQSLPNVVVTPNTNDMRPIFGRARLLLAPSLWWESAGRVVAEAMLNGIPALVGSHGGMPEMVQDGGVVLRFGERFHQRPYNVVPPPELLAPVVAEIEGLYDDSAHYAEMCERARRTGSQRHAIEVSTRLLLQALAPLAAQRAGDADTVSALRNWHRHGLDDRVLTPTAKQPSQAASSEDAQTP